MNAGDDTAAVELVTVTMTAEQARLVHRALAATCAALRGDDTVTDSQRTALVVDLVEVGDTLLAATRDRDGTAGTRAAALYAHAVAARWARRVGADTLADWVNTADARGIPRATEVRDDS